MTAPAPAHQLANPPPPPPAADASASPTGPGGSTRMEPVATFSRAWEAELARGLLEQHGITALVDAAAASNPYPSLMAAGEARVRLLVPRPRVEEARAVLSEVT